GGQWARLQPRSARWECRGLSVFAGGYEIVGKRLELLKEMVPRASRVAVLLNPGNPFHALGLKEVETAARSLKVQLHTLQARHPDDFDRAFAAMTKEHADGFLRLAAFGIHSEDTYGSIFHHCSKRAMSLTRLPCYSALAFRRRLEADFFAATFERLNRDDAFPSDQ